MKNLSVFKFVHTDVSMGLMGLKEAKLWMPYAICYHWLFMYILGISWHVPYLLFCKCRNGWKKKKFWKPLKLFLKIEHLLYGSSLNSAWLNYLYLFKTAKKVLWLKVMITLKEIPWFYQIHPSFSPGFKRQQTFCSSLKSKLEIMLPYFDWESLASSSHPLLPWEHGLNLRCFKIALCATTNCPRAVNEMKCIFPFSSEFQNFTAFQLWVVTALFLASGRAGLTWCLCCFWPFGAF